eukprot:TRINITY_DN3116_c1_g5_i1.p1 TRINITY_DN3116_c1_g5~~TRINITY_DN3116_c1_g5_i1.p1  ORF type:complete len:176 (-),score=1.00 TRINITY_DN3116_c1_g5_i1:78-605(-)
MPENSYKTCTKKRIVVLDQTRQFFMGPFSLINWFGPPPPQKNPHGPPFPQNLGSAPVKLIPNTILPHDIRAHTQFSFAQNIFCAVDLICCVKLYRSLSKFLTTCAKCTITRLKLHPFCSQPVANRHRLIYNSTKPSRQILNKKEFTGYLKSFTDHTEQFKPRPRKQLYTRQCLKY